MAIEAAERQGDDVLNGTHQLSHGEALDALASVRRWCPADTFALRHDAVAAAHRARGYDL